MLFNIRLPTIFETLSLLSILSPFANASTFPNQPNPFTGVTINAAGDLAVVCTSNQWFIRSGASTVAWTLGTASTGLSGMIGVAMNSDGSTVTFAGNDGFRAYSGLTISSTTLPTLVTTSSSNVNSLSMTTGGLQAMGTLDGGIWTSAANAGSFVKYVRVGANAGAGENFVPIGAVGTYGTVVGALGVTYADTNGRGYVNSDLGTDNFAVIANKPTESGALTSLCLASATQWYATFRSAANGGTVAVQGSASDAAWADVAVGNDTVFPTAQHIASANGGVYLVVCANDQVLISSDSGTNFELTFPYFDQALQSWSSLMPDTPLKAAISSTAGLEVVVITRLSIYSATCSYGAAVSCAWSVVSIQTSTATYLAQEGSNISGKSGDVHYSSNNGGLSWNVQLQSGDVQKLL